MALGVMAGLWPLRPRSLHAGFWAGERVMGVNQNISGLRRDGRSLAIAPEALTRRSLRRGARYGVSCHADKRKIMASYKNILSLLLGLTIVFAAAYRLLL